MSNALPTLRDCERKQPVWSSVISPLRFFEPTAEAVEIYQRASMAAPTDFVDSVMGDNTLALTVTVKPGGVGASWLPQIRIPRLPSPASRYGCKAPVHAHFISATMETVE